ncbi:MAG: TetR/AcrR family transcriptional regulator [Solirubrobacteraceae bacterium]
MSLVSRHPDLEPRLGARRDDVAQGQRARLLAAIAHVVGERGWAATTVAEVVREAGVSRSTFYEHFAGKDACFLEAYRHGMEVLDAEVDRAVTQAAPGDWRAQLRAGIRAYLGVLEADEATARTYLLEIHHAGEAALAERTAAMRRFAERYRASGRAAGAREAHPESLFVLCAGTEQLCAERLRAGASVSDLEDVFMLTAEAVLLGTNPDQEES